MVFFFFQAEDGIRDGTVTGVQTCALPISLLVAPEGHSSAPRFGRRADGKGRSACRSERGPCGLHWSRAGGKSYTPAFSVGPMARLCRATRFRRGRRESGD